MYIIHLHHAELLAFQPNIHRACYVLRWCIAIIQQLCSSATGVQRNWEDHSPLVIYTQPWGHALYVPKAIPAPRAMLRKATVILSSVPTLTTWEFIAKLQKLDITKQLHSTKYHKNQNRTHQLIHTHVSFIIPMAGSGAPTCVWHSSSELQSAGHTQLPHIREVSQIPDHHSNLPFTCRLNLVLDIS